MLPSVSYETYPWKYDPDDLMGVSKRRRRRIRPTYEAAVPATIADVAIDLPAGLLRGVEEAEHTARLYALRLRDCLFDLPALILRSEASSSSQIEGIRSSVRNVALAEVGGEVSRDARLIAGNVAAMREARGQRGPITRDAVCAIHDALMRDTGETLGIRSTQVWIGGMALSPHGAHYVAPHALRVPACLDDLMAFCCRDDISPVTKAAVGHAQFETIHPFTDGNGRTGRVLLHRLLSEDGVLPCATLPISAGLLLDTDSYMEALDAYHAGDIEPIVTCAARALELSCLVGTRMVTAIERVLNSWVEGGADTRRLVSLLVGNPVVDERLVATGLSVTEGEAIALIAGACERGVLRKVGNARRGIYYQASELIDVLEEASSLAGIRRIASR